MLWFNVIIPNLLPFMILSNLIISLNAASYITFLFAPFLKFLFGISKDGCYAVITGFLCGYPMGAKITADLVTSHKISRSEGIYLLSFCNNVSPIFIINYIINETFHSQTLLKPVCIIIYLSPILCAIVIRPLIRKNAMKYNDFSFSTCEAAVDFKLIDNAILNGFEAITKLGGYIILFALLSQMLIHIPLQHTFLKYWMISLTEITNGLSIVSGSSLSFACKFIIVLTSVSFGGLSCVAQTQSMIKSSGLPIYYYILSKLLNLSFTLFLSIIYLFILNRS
ncbi:transporter [Lachnotalea glycerini]|uniref:Transporter n=2 Tax=Lachnotalea glycerini TaxID=1763509 RepID=A0A371JJ41_9FIRM|nr:transporter [Lachnotalea glycerini]